MRALAIAAAVIAAVGCSDDYRGTQQHVGATTTTAAHQEPQRVSRNEFRNLVEDKGWNEVIAAVGKPDATQEVGDIQFWYYEGRTFDPVTGRPDSRAQLTIRRMAVKGISFY